MIATFLSALLVIILAHYAYIVPDMILASVATTLAIMITLGNLLNKQNKTKD